jgi:hypothetical protein
MRVLADTLDGTNPFTLLADGVPGARMAMGEQTLVVVGAEFAGGSPGFIILTDQVNLASGEELQDHSCAIGRSSGLMVYFFARIGVALGRTVEGVYASTRKIAGFGGGCARRAGSGTRCRIATIRGIPHRLFGQRGPA